MKSAFRISVVIAIVCSLLVGNLFAVASASDTKHARKQEIIQLIVHHHVSGIEEKDLDTTDIDSIIESLDDPYTQYFTPNEWAKFLDMLENNYTGIGIRIGEDQRGIFVHEVFAGTPADDSGLMEGDYIVTVDGKPAAGKKTDDLVSEITGEEGTVVKIEVLREDKKISFSITRKQIHIPAVTSRMFADEGIGYIRVSSFSSDADELFSARVDEMKKQGMSSLVLDLRDNPGGLLETAGNMAARFIDKGNLIMTRDRTKVKSPYPIKGNHTLDLQVVVLVNEFSASASEVLSGALQDYGIATLIGKKTYGKGSVQSLYELDNGGVLKLTIQEYLTPLGRPVNQVGLDPDYEVAGAAAQLITALQKAGDINISLTLDNKGIIINGFTFNDTFKVIRDNGLTYVPSRVLAALVDNHIEWNSERKSVMFQDGDKEIEYLVNSEGVKLNKGVSYVALSRFQTRFANVGWSDKDGVLSIVEDRR